MGNETFKVGDIVQLRSGGPDMTIISVGISYISKEPLVGCKWFDASHTIMSDEFPPESLVKVRNR